MDLQDEDAKTQLSKPKQRPSKEKSKIDPAPAGDKTRLVKRKVNAGPADDKTRLVKRQVETASADDKTRLVKRAPVASKKPVANDKTQLKVNPARTGVKPASPRGTKAESIQQSDATVLAVPKRKAAAPAAAPSADRTQFVRGNRHLPPVAPQTAAVAQATSTTKSSMPILKERFVFEEVLGAGGMGMVYKAKDLLKVEARDRSPYVAIKVLGDEFKSHPEAFIALQRESRKSQLIAHPNIVNVFDFDKDKDTVFMTMELLEGTPLDKLIAQYRATGIPKEDAWIILEGMCLALEHAHKEHIIHSDFKPGNIFVTEKGLAKVFDFGIARAVSKAESHEDDIHDKTVFDAGNFGALTPAYASKEMLEGEEPDVTDDIYALGCITYGMFTGKHPFDRVHANEAEKQKLKPVRDPIFTKKQWQVIESALAFNRADRVQTVEEYWARLTHKKRSPVKMILSSTLIIFLMATIGYLTFFQEKPQRVSEEDVRSQIEYKLRLEQHKRNINALVKSLEFSKAWELTLWDEMTKTTNVLGLEDEWIISTRATIYAAYSTKISELISSKNLSIVDRLLTNGAKYAGDPQVIAKLAASLQQLRDRLAFEKEQRLQQQVVAKKKQRQQVQQAKVTKRQRDNFNQALANVNEQVACRSGLNMRDLDITVTKLRQIDIVRYRKGEAGFVTSLAACIERIGKTFPHRAKEYKKFAIRIFPNNKVINRIAIVPKDPCNKSLAGLGARGKRAICYDSYGKNQRGPTLVVVPAKGSQKHFAISKYEVSKQEFARFCTESEQCKLDGENVYKPVTNISYTQTQSYIQWLNTNTNQTYRLPTRSEWVYAAKANSESLDSNRNCKLNSRGIQKGKALIKARVGSQNKWGLVNYVGNAQEFVTDNGGVIKVAGGSFQTPMEECTTSLITRHTGQADKATGFRLVREIAVR